MRETVLNVKENRPYFLALTGLRGIAAIFVFLQHVSFGAYIQTLPDWLQVAITPLLSSGKASVYIFCMLGGFLITTHYPTITQPFAFVQKRYARLYPVLLALTAYMLLLDRVRPSFFVAICCFFAILGIVWLIKTYTPPRIFFITLILLQISIATILIVHKMQSLAFSPVTTTLLSYGMYVTLTFPLATKPIVMHNTYYWTLWFEIIFYWLYAYGVVAIIQHIHTTKQLRRFAIVGGISMLFLSIVMTLFVTIPLIKFNWHFYYLGRGYVWWYFFCGIALGLLMRTPHTLTSRWVRRITRHTWIGVLTGVVYFICTSFVNNRSVSIPVQMSLDLILSPLLILFFLTLLHNRRFISRIVANPVCNLYGRISYPFYLLHVPIMNYIAPQHWRITQAHSVLLLWCSIFITTTICAYITHKILE